MTRLSSSHLRAMNRRYMAAARTETVGRIRAYDLGGHSDEALRRIVSMYARNAAPEDTRCLLPLVFAVVNEAIGRRLGVWRIFDPRFRITVARQAPSCRRRNRE